MFSLAEMDTARPIIYGFKEMLLTGDYNICIEYIKRQDQLEQILISNFDRSKRVREIMRQIKPLEKENTEHYILFNMLMIRHDEYCYQPWIEMYEAFREGSLLHSFECLLIYHNLRNKEFSRLEAEDLKVDLFRKWEKLKDLCIKNKLWIEAFYATFQQASISDEYLINYITLIDYNIEKLNSTPALQHLEKDRFVVESKSFLEKRIGNKKFGNWIQAILYELDGELDKSIDCRVKDYRKHKNPMILIRKLYSIKEFDRLQAFLEEELETEPQNSEIAKSLKRLEILKIASALEDEETARALEEAVFKGSEVPSGEKLNELCSSLNKPEMRESGVQIFNLFQQLFPLDHEVCKYYGKILEADGKIEEAFKAYDLMLMSAFDERRAIADIRIVAISALINECHEYALKVFSKLDEMVELQEEIDMLKKSGKRYGLNDLHKLYIQVKAELSALISLYGKVTEAQNGEDQILKQSFKSICAKAEEYDCLGIADELLDEKHSKLLDFEEVRTILNITANFSKKDFPLKFYIIDRFIKCIEKGCGGYERILNVASCVERALSTALSFVYDNKASTFPYVKEAIGKLSSYNEVNATLNACIDLLHDSKDHKERKFVMLLMTSLFNCSRNIKSIYESNYDKEQNKKLIIELSKIYVEDLKKNTYFHMKLGFDLLGCFYAEEARSYFGYAMNNLSEEEKGESTSILMYHVCDLLMKMERGMNIDPADYDKKSFFAKALLSIVQKTEYSGYVSKYLSCNEDDKDSTVVIIHAYKAALNGDYDKARSMLKSLRDEYEIYEACEIQISSLSVKKNHSTGEAVKADNIELQDSVKKEGAAAKDESAEMRFVNEFLKIFDNMDNAEDVIEELPRFAPVLAEALSGCEIADKDLEGQYKVWAGVVDRYVGNVEALSIPELSRRSDASLKAAAAARILGMYNEFFKYLAEYCETELERSTRGQKIFNSQVALAYESHLIWYAKYRCLIDKSSKKLNSYHMAFFKAHTLIDDFSALLQNIQYGKRINLLFSRLGYRFFTVYQEEYRDKKEGILNCFYLFAAAIEKYANAENSNEKRIYIDDAVNQIKKMDEIAEQQFYKRDKYDINAFTNNLLFACNEEIKKLENKPVIKVTFLNRQDIHTKGIDNGTQQDKLQSSFHFLAANEGKAKADEFVCTFKILKDNKLLGTPYVQEKQTLREGEKLAVGFKYIFEEEGDFGISVETSFSDGEFQTFNYCIEVKSQEFVFQRISENTYPTAPIDDERKFFGRKAILNRIKDCLYDDGDRTTFLIYGLRRVGKTSLLNHVESIMKDKFYPIQCDCQNVFDADNTGQLIYQLFVENIVYGLSDDYGIDIEMPSEEAFEASPLRQLKRFFMNVERNIGDKSLLLLIDEFDEVVKKVEDGIYSDELFDFIRTKMQHSNKTRFIIAGGEYLLNIMKKKALKISDTAKPLEVGFLEPDEAREMVEKPLGLKGIKCLPGAVERFLMITCRHPYFLTAVGNGVVELLNREKERYVVYPDDVEAVSEKLIDMTQKSMYEHFWNSLDSGYKKLVVAIIAEQSQAYDDYIDIDRLYDRMKELHSAGGISGLYKDKVRAIVNELIAGRILSNENKDDLAVCIAVEQLRRWTRRWKNADEVLNEIQGGTGVYV